MANTVRFLVIVRDATDAFGTAWPADLLKAARMDRNTLARGIGELAKQGLVEINADSGAVSLTLSGRRELLFQDLPLPGTDAPDSPPLTPGIGTAPQPGSSVAQPPALPPLEMKAPVPPPSPGTEPVFGTPSGQAAQPPRSGRRPKPPPPLMTKETAAGAVKQVQDVAVAAGRRRATKKVAAQPERPPRSRPRDMDPGLESMTTPKRPPKVKRPKRAMPKAKVKRPARKVSAGRRRRPRARR